MNGEVIREFLVRLAYAVDEHSKNKFIDGLTLSTTKAILLAEAIKKTAVVVVEGAAKMANGLEQVYFAARRTGSEAEKLTALSYAARQAGAGVESAAGSLEGLARFLRMNPGGEGFLHNLGIQTRDAQGNLRDMTELLFDFARATQNMPLHQAAALGAVFGLDEATLLALRSGEIQKHFREHQEMLRRSGVDLKGATEDSRRFMLELRSLGAVFDLLQTAATAALATTIGPQLRQFREWLLANTPRIAAAIGEIGLACLEVAKLVASMGKSIYEAAKEAVKFFQGLDADSKAAITTVALLLAGWLALNAGILASPVGAVLALGTAIAALWEDFQTWRQGGDSLLNWGVWGTELAAARDGITALASAIGDLLGPAVSGFASGIGETMRAVWKGAFSDPIGNTVREIKNLIAHLADVAQLMAAAARGDWDGFRRAAASIGARLLPGGGVTENPDILNPTTRENAANPSLAERLRRLFPDWLGGGTPEGVPAAGGPSAGVGEPVPARQVSSAREAYAFWKSKGFTDAGAAGMVANEMRESGFDPSARGDGGKAHGLFQHHADRRAAILRATGIDMSTASAAQQREAMYQEMSRGLDAQSGLAFERIKNATSAHTASELMVRHVERPADKDGETRIRGRQAEAIQRQFDGVALGPVVSTDPAVQRAAEERAAAERPGWRVPGGVPRAAQRFQSPGLAPPGAATAGGNGTTIAPTLNANTNININGNASPEGIARAQRGVNDAAIRNMAGAVR